MYLSNCSDQSVYFDNFKVQVAAGNIIEENHYYAYGLKIAAISSVKLGDGAEGGLQNNHLYNDKELIDDADLNWYDYGFRNYDPQTGRFMQLDPLTDEYPFLTPYQYASNDPITNIDIDGLEGGVSVGGSVGNSVSQAVHDFSYSYKTVSSLADFIVPIQHSVTAASTVIKTTQIVSPILMIILRSSATLIDVLNNHTTVQQVGTQISARGRQALDMIYEHELPNKGASHTWIDQSTDKGGLTNYGIAYNRAEWKAAAKMFGIQPTQENLKNITKSQADMYYEETRIKAIGIDKITNEAVALVIADQSVLGPNRVLTTIREVLNDNGNKFKNNPNDPKPLTQEEIDAINTVDPRKFGNELLDKIQAKLKAKKSKANGRGWQNRVDKDRAIINKTL